LKDEWGFSSDHEVRKWLIVFHNLDVKYRTIHELVRYRLKGKLKIPRPLSIKQHELEREEFKKN
jgi:putative transposase